MRNYKHRNAVSWLKRWLFIGFSTAFALAIILVHNLLYIPDVRPSHSERITYIKEEGSYADKLLDPGAIFTFALVVSTILLWRSTERLANLAAKQARDTAESVRIAATSADAAKASTALAERNLTELERPYIFLENPVFIGSTYQNRSPTVRYLVRNCGRTPAIIRWLRAEVQTRIALTQEPEKIEPGKNLFVEVFNSRKVLAKDEAAEIVPPERSPFYYPRYREGINTTLSIKIEYFDVFGWVHTAEFKFFEREGVFHAIGAEEYTTEAKDWQPSW